jgi:hypothetical protein
MITDVASSPQLLKRHRLILSLPFLKGPPQDLRSFQLHHLIFSTIRPLVTLIKPTTIRTNFPRDSQLAMLLTVRLTANPFYYCNFQTDLGNTA